MDAPMLTVIGLALILGVIAGGVCYLMVAFGIGNADDDGTGFP